MYSLEFINKEIERRKESIEFWTNRLKDYPNDEVITRCLNTRKEELQALFLIKSKLEAWEVVENKNVKIGTVRTSPNYEVFNSLFNSDTIEKNRITEIEFDIIQKALEAEK